MNLIWFLVAIILFYGIYWYILVLVIHLPAIPVGGLMMYLLEGSEKKWARILYVPVSILAFLVGGLIPSAVFGMGLGLITLNFTAKAAHTIIYFLIGGFAAFIIRAPSGETSVIAMFLSLIFYVIVVTINKFAMFSALSFQVLFNIVLWILGIMVVVGIVCGTVNKILKKVKVKQIKK